MTDLSDLVPLPEPDKDALALVGGMALELLPTVGPMLSRTLDYAIASRAAQRRYEFDLAVVHALQRNTAAQDNALTLTDIIDSDEFVAAYTRATRIAAETASVGKRQRLAEVVATCAAPSDFATAELDAYAQLVEQYDDLRVWLLAFYCDPAKWLNTNGLSAAADPRIRGGRMDEPLRAALNVDVIRKPAVLDALADLQRDSVLGAFSLDTMRSDRGQFNGQTTRRGRRFLRFIRENNPAETTPPDTL